MKKGIAVRLNKCTCVHSMDHSCNRVCWCRKHWKEKVGMVHLQSDVKMAVEPQSDIPEGEKRLRKYICDEIDLLLKKKEQVHGFQPYPIPNGEEDGFDIEKRDRKIFFDGFDDGRNMLKIDLMRLRDNLKNK